MIYIQVDGGEKNLKPITEGIEEEGVMYTFENLFNCSVRITDGEITLNLDGAVIKYDPRDLPGGLDLRKIGQNAARFVKRERFVGY